VQSPYATRFLLSNSLSIPLNKKNAHTSDRGLGLKLGLDGKRWLHCGQEKLIKNQSSLRAAGLNG